MDKERLLLEFDNSRDLEYFISKEADHWCWLSSSWYGARKISDNTIQIDDGRKFEKLISKDNPNYANNIKVIMGRKLINGSKVEYVPMNYHIIRLI